MIVAIDIGKQHNLRGIAWNAVYQVISDGFTSFRIQFPFTATKAAFEKKMSDLILAGAQKVMITISDFPTPSYVQTYSRLIYRKNNGLLSNSDFQKLTSGNDPMFRQFNCLPPFTESTGLIDQGVWTIFDDWFDQFPTDKFVFQVILEPYTVKRFWGTTHVVTNNNYPNGYPNELHDFNLAAHQYFRGKGFTTVAPSFTKGAIEQGGGLFEKDQIPAGHWYHYIRIPGTSQFQINYIDPSFWIYMNGGIIDAWNKYASGKFLDQNKLNLDWDVSFDQAYTAAEAYNIKYFTIHKLIDMDGGNGLGMFDINGNPKPYYTQLVNYISGL